MSLNYCILFLIFKIITAHDMDYCDKPCKTPRTHTLCVYSEGPSAECIDYKPVPLSEEEKTRIVHRLNERRNYVAMGLHSKLPSASNMLQMTWVNALARSAQRWADQCIPYAIPDQNDICRNLMALPAGQVIATVPGPSPGLLVETMVDMWYIQAAFYQGNLSFYTESPRDKTYSGGLTQILWADTHFVGCGRAEFSTEYGGPYTRLVCNFAPEGNLHGGRVWIPGIPCNACPRYAKCSGEYHGLCLEEDNMESDTIMLHNIQNIENGSDHAQISESTVVETTNYEDDVISLNEEPIISEFKVTETYSKIDENDSVESYGIPINKTIQNATPKVSTEDLSVPSSTQTVKKSVKLIKSKKPYKWIKTGKDASKNDALAKSRLIEENESYEAKAPELHEVMMPPNSKLRRNSNGVPELRHSKRVHESEDDKHLRELFEGLVTSTTESDDLPPHATESIDQDASALTSFFKTIPIVKNLFKTNPGYLYEPGQTNDSGPNSEGGAASMDSLNYIRSVFIASLVRYILL